jgi:hypothetical protein
MRRREFVTLLGSKAATWPLGARGQQPGGRVYWFVFLFCRSATSALTESFKAIADSFCSLRISPILTHLGNHERWPMGSDLIHFKL